MFQKPRQLLHRHTHAAEPHAAMTGHPADEIAPVREARHPAMRGLNVSPVHGRHCICDRCAADRRAA